jgi:hypothetical protein
LSAFFLTTYTIPRLTLRWAQRRPSSGAAPDPGREMKGTSALALTGAKEDHSKVGHRPTPQEIANAPDAEAADPPESHRPKAPHDRTPRSESTQTQPLPTLKAPPIIAPRRLYPVSPRRQILPHRPNSISVSILKVDLLQNAQLPPRKNRTRIDFLVHRSPGRRGTTSH